MQQAKVISFSAPARYAEVLEHVPNKSALIVEALDRYFVGRNYGVRAKATVKPIASEKKANKGSVTKTNSMADFITQFRNSLPEENRSITLDEIRKFRDQGRA